MKSVIARLAEPSTYAGLAGVVVGVGNIIGVKAPPVIGDALGQVAQQVAHGMPWWQAALIAGAGALAVVMPEKGVAS